MLGLSEHRGLLLGDHGGGFSLCLVAPMFKCIVFPIAAVIVHATVFRFEIEQGGRVPERAPFGQVQKKFRVSPEFRMVLPWVFARISATRLFGVLAVVGGVSSHTLLFSSGARRVGPLEPSAPIMFKCRKGVSSRRAGSKCYLSAASVRVRIYN